MSLAKATFSGRVYREPQKRSTSNNVPITYFTFDIGSEGEEELIRIRAVGNLADTVEKVVAKNDLLVVEGNLMLTTIKTETGAEKRIVDLGLVSFEKIVGSQENSYKATSAGSGTEENIVKFAQDEAEDLIDEDEIPF